LPDRRTRYERLSPDEQRILRVLSVICEPVGQAALQQVLDALGWHDRDGAPLSRLLGKALRERLLADGLVEQPGGALTCHPDLLEPLTRETVAILRQWLSERRGEPADPLFPTRQGRPLSRWRSGPTWG
jgi:hypothetical protein